ncbi:hypothetical protein [Anaerotignum sp.]
MATYTENYNLTKPGEEDFFSVADLNDNMDSIDSLMAEGESAMASIDGKIGTAQGGETVLGMLQEVKNGMGTGGLIKSLQRVTHNVPTSSGSSSVSIRTVDPSKCLVIMERLEDDTNSGCDKLLYTLETDKISMTHYSRSSTNIRLGFWIIEFNF